MITDKDVEKLKDVFATKKELTDLQGGMHEEFRKLQASIDAYAKKVDTYAQEMTVLGYQVDRNTKHIQQVADKINFKLEY